MCIVCDVLIDLPLPSKCGVCSKRISANLLVVIPLLIAIRKEEVTRQSDGWDVRQELSIYNVDDAVIYHRQQRRNIR